MGVLYTHPWSTMSVTMVYNDLDVYFDNTRDKVVVNDIDYYDLSESSKLEDDLLTRHVGANVSVLPKCGCEDGGLSGLYNIGRTCDICGVRCETVYATRDPLLWLRTLSRDVSFINPALWMDISKALNSRTDYLLWLCVPSHKIKNKIPNYINGVVEVMGGRSYVRFINAIHEILEYLLSHSKFKSFARQENIRLLLANYNSDKSTVFSQHLPVINKGMFVMTMTNKGRFANVTTMSQMVDVVMTWLGNSDGRTLTEVKLNKLMATTISKLAIMNLSYYTIFLDKKGGGLRKHVYGARLHFTFRCVIVTLPDPHRYDEVLVPWAVGVTCYRPHLLNKLVREENYTYKEASSLLFRSIKTYDATIHKSLTALIEEAGGLPMLTSRNPGQDQGSIQFVRCYRFKTNPLDFTVAFSDMVMKGPNADVDGDQMSYTPLLDAKMVELFKVFEPHHTIADTEEVFGINKNLTLEPQDNVVLASFIEDSNDVDLTNGDFTEILLNMGVEV